MTEPKETIIGAGQTLFRQGEKGGELFFIKGGEIDLTVRDEKTGSEAVVATVGDKAVLGTMSFLEGDLRSATATAKTEVKCVMINQVQRERLLKTIPQWFHVLVKDLSSTVRRLNLRLTVVETENLKLKKRVEIMDGKLKEIEAKEKEKENEESKPGSE